jgi:hypothetical protein
VIVEAMLAGGFAASGRAAMELACGASVETAVNIVSSCPAGPTGVLIKNWCSRDF